MRARPGSHRFYHRRAESINRPAPSSDASRCVPARRGVWRRRRRRHPGQRRGHRQLEVLRRERRRGLRASLLNHVGRVAPVAVRGLGDHHIAVAVAHLRGGIDVGEAADFLEALLVGYRQFGEVGQRSVALRAQQAEARQVFERSAAAVFHRPAPGQPDAFRIRLGREIVDPIRMSQLGRNRTALRAASGGHRNRDHCRCHNPQPLHRLSSLLK